MGIWWRWRTRRWSVRLLGLGPSSAAVVRRTRVIRVSRRSIVFAKNVFTKGIGGCRKSEGQLGAWHINRGKRALLGSRRKRLRRGRTQL
ncbi:hypothetical protein EDB83DRAFT_2329968 [Lactarius deliciosus]|nr:hypothetical protein EDB83DRAFT_2329968 [Lactarius deliciosus]